MTSTPPSPLAATLARIADRLGDACLVGTPPGPGWFSLEEARDPEVVDAWVARIRATTGGSDAVTGSFLASWVSGAITGPLVRALLGERRGWPLDPGRTFVHRHDDGWFDGLALASPAIFVLPDDPAAGDPDAVLLADEPALRVTAVAGLVTCLVPVFAAIRVRTRLGLPAMWGGVVDGIAWTTLAVADARGLDRDRALADGMALADDLGRLVALPRVRPTLVPLDTSVGGATELVRGTCCLWYRTQADADPAGEGYCDSCPRREPIARRRRWIAAREGADACPPEAG